MFSSGVILWGTEQIVLSVDPASPESLYQRLGCPAKGLVPSYLAWVLQKELAEG